MHLLQNPIMPIGADLTPLFIIGGIWSVVGIAFFVWYLWSLSKLFPHLGIKGAWGWIPVWNQWQLIQRGGLPGWMVLLALVPGVGALVVLVVMIIAINRINAEFGKGGGMTLLGIVLAPLWAMLLANHITDGRYGAAAEWAPAREGAAAHAETDGSVGGALRGLPHANVPPQDPAFAQQGYAPQGFAPQPAAQQGFAPQGFEPQSFEPQSFEPQSAAPQGYQPQGQMQPVPQAPQGPQAVEPVAPQAGAHGAEFEQLGFQPQPIQQEAQRQRSVFAPPASGQPFEASNAPSASEAPAAPVAPVAPAASQPQYPANAAAPTPPAQGQGGWGFSATTEGAYERLAAEGTQAPNAMPLGAPVAQQPFSWPAPQAEEAVSSTVDAVATELPQPPVPPVAMPQPPVPSVPVPPVAAPSAPVTPVAPSAPVPPVAAPSAPVAPVAPAAPAQADPAQDMFAAVSTQDDFEEDDQTVVVRRETRWGLELPDGELMELFGHDVVVGRKPEPAGAYEVLKINDPTRTLSKSHVRLRRTGEVWTIEDLHSTNGVALIDETGATVELEAGHERGTTERMLIGTLEVRLIRMP